MRQNNRVRMRLMREIASGEKFRWGDVAPAVRRMGYRIERLPEYENEEFIYAERKAVA